MPHPLLRKLGEEVGESKGTTWGCAQIRGKAERTGQHCLFIKGPAAPSTQALHLQPSSDSPSWVAYPGGTYHACFFICKMRLIMDCLQNFGIHICELFKPVPGIQQVLHRVTMPSVCGLSWVRLE